MCGIAGIYQLSGSLLLEDAVKTMTSCLEHRGPDNDGFWFDREHGLALGHRRLAILDLSDSGRQPMVSSCKRYVIVLNGEIYNYKQIKAELVKLGYVFKGRSDTEVLLEAIAKWGFEEALKKATGMFAVAVYDNFEKTLSLARDRIGEKPLYYAHAGGRFLFASELKAIGSVSNLEIDIDALALYFRHNYIPAPYTIYRGVKKLEPGCLLTVTPSGIAVDLSTRRYWSLAAVIDNGQSNLLHQAEEELISDFDHLLRTVVGEQMVADVPLGAFLSGGIDSSAVVAIMQSLSSRPIKTFSIGFQEDDYDEAGFARAVAKHIGTEHTELYVSPEEALKFAVKMPAYYDEPFADSSQIPTCIVAQLAKEQVTVSLSGDGGDELFGGYNNYSRADTIWKRAGSIPKPFSRAIESITGLMPLGGLDLIGKAASPFLGQNDFLNGDRINKLTHLMAAKSRADLYRNLISVWPFPEAVVKQSKEPSSMLTRPDLWPKADLNFIEWMMYIDAVSYLPDDILVKVDRACMAVSLESRIPLLDHRVIEYAWKLPFKAKVKEGQKKWLLKQLLYRYVPQELFNRPKQGFAVPIGAWLRGPLKEWAEALLAEERIRKDGFLNYATIATRWHEHQQGKRNWQHSLWTVLMFQAWLEKRG